MEVVYLFKTLGEFYLNELESRVLSLLIRGGGIMS